MCLKVKNKIRLDKDITVYKVLKVGEFGSLQSPFYNFIYDSGGVYHSNFTASVIPNMAPSYNFLRQADNPLIRELMRVHNVLCIEKGFHSFSKETDAADLAHYLNINNIDGHYVIGEFIIPKGIEVYEGEYETPYGYDVGGCYASDQIIFTGKTNYDEEFLRERTTI